MLTIGASGVDTDAVIRGIREAVDRKSASGRYRAEGLDEASLRFPLDFGGHSEFLDDYLKQLRDVAFVDINDFEIIERRSGFRAPLVRLKRLIWSLLRFYTYRLWSQQNQINGLLLAAAEGVYEQQRKQIARLESRLRELEKKIQNQAGDTEVLPSSSGDA